MKKFPKGRTLAEFQPLQPAETALLQTCAEGKVAVLGKERPAEKTEENAVRASFIRFLALGGDDEAPVHERGVQLAGAWIEGVLDLKSAVTASGLSLNRSYFESPPMFRGAEIAGTLTLSGSQVPGLQAARLQCKGSLFMSGGFTSIGEIRLLGAQIEGNLECKGAKMEGSSGMALACDGMQVTGAFFFCGLASPVKGVSLASAKVGRLIDDEDSWGGELVLNGFVYEHLAGGAPTDATTRLAWIKKQSHKFIEKEDFRPQPWKQLQKVLHAMGHTEDARQVGIAFEDHLRAIGLIGQTPANWQTWRRTAYSHVAKAFHFSFKWLIGYGYRPLRLGAWMVGVWLVCAFVYWSAALQGVMAPSNPLVFQNMPQYESCKPNWYLCEALPEEYTGFSPLAYSLDVLLPLVNLQQEQDWAALIPTPKGSWYQELGNLSFKHLVRLVIWFEILFGWVASLLLVAVVSGLTKRSED